MFQPLPQGAPPLGTESAAIGGVGCTMRCLEMDLCGCVEPRKTLEDPPNRKCRDYASQTQRLLSSLLAATESLHTWQYKNDLELDT